MRPCYSSHRFWAAVAILSLAGPGDRQNLLGQESFTVSNTGSRTTGTEAANPAHAEVELGEFVVPVRMAESNSTITIFTKLYATVRISEKEKFEAELEARQARFREKVLVSLRGASRDDLYERGLDKVKKRLLAAVMEAIEAPSAYRVGFVSFYYNEE